MLHVCSFLCLSVTLPCPALQTGLLKYAEGKKFFEEVRVRLGSCCCTSAGLHSPSAPAACPLFTGPMHVVIRDALLLNAPGPAPLPLWLQPSARAYALNRKFGVTAHELDTDTLPVAKFRKLLEVESKTAREPSPVFSALSFLVAKEQAEMETLPAGVQEANAAAAAKDVMVVLGAGVKDLQLTPLKDRICKPQMLFKVYHQLGVMMADPGRWLPTNIDCSVSGARRAACMHAQAAWSLPVTHSACPVMPYG